MKDKNKNSRLKMARTSMNLTQEQLADKLNISRQTVNLIENGKYNPSIDLCINLCKCLEKTLDELFWE
ncbi:MAG: helix-turn-helix transcriptional regulator [Clostridium sp.]|nr:helix-turn-helix transcriptional regulator [Clostridium sp.]